MDANDQNGEAEEEQLPKKKHKKKKVKGNEASVRREPLMLELDAIFQALEVVLFRVGWEVCAPPLWG